MNTGYQNKRLRQKKFLHHDDKRFVSFISEDYLSKRTFDPHNAAFGTQFAFCVEKDIDRNLSSVIESNIEQFLYH